MSTLEEIHAYFKKRIVEIKQLSERGDPWVFLCCSSFIDYMVRATYNRETSSSLDYKEFIKDYLSQIDERYRDFQYQSGKRDLPEQMYHILRCGVTHSFSLVPDAQSLRKGGRQRSILLAHRRNGESHFRPIRTSVYDSVVFTAEDFCDDLEKLLSTLFTDVALSDPTIATNIVDWYSRYPPIMSLRIEEPDS